MVKIATGLAVGAGDFLSWAVWSTAAKVLVSASPAVGVWCRGVVENWLKQAELAGGCVPIGLVTELGCNGVGRRSMGECAVPANPLPDLEALQDDVLRRLEELNGRVEQVLAEWLSEKAGAKG